VSQEQNQVATTEQPPLKTRDQDGNPWPRIAIAVPQERAGPPTDDIFYSFWHIAQSGYPIIEVPYQRCDMAHNRAACLMMMHNDERRAEGYPEHTFTHLISLDIDHRHPANIARHWGRAVQQFPDRLVIGGLNYRRSAPYDPCAYMQAPEGGAAAIKSVPLNSMGPVDYLGAGSLIMAAEVFERMRAAGVFPFFGYEYKERDWKLYRWDELANMRFPGPDMWFSKRCKELGIQLWLDTSITSPHLTRRWIDGDAWEAHQQTEAFRWGYLMHDERLGHLRRLIPELWEAPGDVLYIGANKKRAHYARELKEAGGTLTLLEIDPRNVAFWQDEQRATFFTNILQGDVREALVWPANDTVFWWHGPEHIKRVDLGPALRNVEAQTKPGGLVVIGCPWGTSESLAGDYERHIGAYYPEDFEQRGYTVFTDGTRNSIESTQIAWKRIT